MASYVESLGTDSGPDQEMVSQMHEEALGSEEHADDDKGEEHVRCK